VGQGSPVWGNCIYSLSGISCVRCAVIAHVVFFDPTQKLQILKEARSRVLLLCKIRDYSSKSAAVHEIEKIQRARHTLLVVKSPQILKSLRTLIAENIDASVALFAGSSRKNHNTEQFVKSFQLKSTTGAPYYPSYHRKASNIVIIMLPW
jgi:hypothetical protein